jgi:hypothetical protein
MEFSESVKLGNLQSLGGFLTFPAPDSKKNQATTKDRHARRLRNSGGIESHDVKGSKIEVGNDA